MISLEQGASKIDSGSTNVIDKESVVTTTESISYYLFFPNSVMAQKLFIMIVDRLQLLVLKTIPPNIIENNTICDSLTINTSSSTITNKPVACDKTVVLEHHLLSKNQQAKNELLLGTHLIADTSNLMMLMSEAEWFRTNEFSQFSSSNECKESKSIAENYNSILASKFSNISYHTNVGVNMNHVEFTDCDMLLFKIIHFDHRDSSLIDYNNFDEIYPQHMNQSRYVKDDFKGWLSCWMKIDRKLKHITVFDQGLKNIPSFSISCHNATMLIPNLADTETDYDIHLYNCNVISSSAAASILQGVSISIAIHFETKLEMITWILNISTLLERVCYYSSGERKYIIGSFDCLAPVDVVTRTSLDDSLKIHEVLDCLRYKPSSMDILLCSIEAIAERTVSSSYLRSVLLTGIQIQTTRFIALNHQRIVLLTKGICTSLSEGSVLLSVNGLSTLSSSFDTIMKFIYDFPDHLLGEFVLFKFPRKEFEVKIFQFHVSAVSKLKETMKTRTLGGKNSIYNVVKKSTESQLNKVILQKRSSILSLQPINADEGTKVIENEAEALSFNEFLRSPLDQIKWTSYRFMIASGNISILPVNRSSNNHSIEETKILCRIQLSYAQIKLIFPTKGESMHDICIELKDEESHILVKCISIDATLELIECLIISMKLMGSYEMNLSHMYDQALEWQAVQEQYLSQSSNLNNDDDDVALKKTNNLLASSSSLLVQSIRQGITQNYGSNESKMDSSLILKEKSNNSSNSSNSQDITLLQAVEDLEQTLSDINLPFDFPTQSIIEDELTDLFKLNNFNHRILSDYLTLQFNFLYPKLITKHNKVSEYTLEHVSDNTNNNKNVIVKRGSVVAHDYHHNHHLSDQDNDSFDTALDQQQQQQPVVKPSFPSRSGFTRSMSIKKSGFGMSHLVNEKSTMVSTIA